MKGFTPRRLALALLLAFLPGVSGAGVLSGRILNVEGTPISGAHVSWTAYRSEEETLADETEGVDPKVLGETTSGADGTFRLTGSGAFSIQIQSPGLPEAFLPGPFDAADSTVLPDLQVPGPVKIAGKVVDEAGKAVTGARIRVRSAGPLSDSDVVFYGEAKSGAGGAFSINDAPEGFRSLGARAAGFVPLVRPELGAGDERVVLKAGGAVRGSVLDASGNPAAGAVVTSGEIGARTDTAGHFRLTGVAVGTRSVAAIWKDEYVARQDGVKVQGATAAEVSLRLARAAAITGTVIDELTRKPVAGARIAVADPGLRFNGAAVRRSVRSDSRGRFQAGGLETGRYTIEATHSGYVPSSIPNVGASVAMPGTAAIALAPAASISGRVLDGKKKPVPGARVQIARQPGLRGLLRRGPGGPGAGADRSAVTGPEGQFQLQALPAGHDLTVEATKAGFAPTRRSGISVKAGEKVANVELTLTAGLGGRGRVVDLEGKPVTGAEIRAQRRMGRGGGAGGAVRFLAASGRAEAKPDAVTGNDGAFALNGLADGDYTLTVTRTGYASKETSVTVKGPEESTWPPIALAPGVAVAGTVKDSQGLPVPGATVFVLADVGRAQATATAGDGSFRLGDLPAGRAVMLAVNADGYASARSGATPPAENVAIVLHATAALRGRVEDAAGGGPIFEFTISLSAGGAGSFGFGGRGGGVFGGPAPQNFRSADGSFELDNVPPGTWTVHAAAPSYRTAEVSGITLASGETREGVVVSLKKGVSVAGKVVDAGSGAPVANVTVSWETAGSPPGPGAMAARLLGGGGANVTATDADGRFAFDGLPDGKITLTATHPDYLQASRDADPSTGTEVQIPLGSGGTITGFVVGSDGSTPVGTAQVRLDDEGDAGPGAGSQTAPVDGSGAFRFDHLGAGRFRLTAQSDKGTSAPKDVVLAENQRQDGVTLQVSSGTTLDGTVTGLPAAQLAGVRVAASGSGYRDSAMTDDSGRFTLREVPSGVLTLTASTSLLQGRTTSKSVEIADGTAEMPVEIAFQGASSLSGRVARGGTP
ncbi:MAG TPA: carboxypeptidase regulatory-like domain-containing protein, partial [Thermoanaerobaculia bacterium]|nr:carboxypeptidase regulatory-like domain-containing protein [Thermoanaerobaculia bacterium]